MEKLNSTLLITPKTLNELALAIEKYPSAQLFAGGTYIMSRVGYYPNSNTNEIITMEKIPELTRIIHVDKYLEVGSMVTIQQLLNSAVNLFSKPLYKAISEIATDLVRKQITIGGSLCTSGIRFAMPCILSALDAQVEIKTATQHKRKTNFLSRTVDHWIPVSKLYDVDANYTFEGKGFLSRIRIPSEQNSIQMFRTIGSPMHDPSKSVIMSLTYNIIQGAITTPIFCLVLPSDCFFCNQLFNNTLAKTAFPISTKTMFQIAQELDKRLLETCKNINEVQRERANRLFLNMLYEANTYYLSN